MFSFKHHTRSGVGIVPIVPTPGRKNTGTVYPAVWYTSSAQAKNGLRPMPMKTQFPLSLYAALLALLLFTPPVRADSPERRASEFASGTGNLLFLGASVGLPLLEDGAQGRNHAFRAADSILTATLLTEALKGIVREKRPQSNSHDSFPSGHATAAFAAATIASQFHPRQAPFWYLGAVLISYSRVRLKDHTVADVVAGAGVGYGITRLEISAPRGLLLSPVITPDGRGMGLQISKPL